MTQPCKSLGLFEKEESGWGTCLACKRFLKLVKDELPDHKKSSGKFSPGKDGSGRAAPHN